MSVPFALSLSKYVNSAGTDIGFASLLAVALLALLYFAGARESRTLRDQLEEAQDRIAALEGRVSQLLRARPAPAANPAPAVADPRPRVVSAPVPVGPMGSALAQVEREAGRTAALRAVAGPAFVGPPVGAAAPALGSATRTLPLWVPVPVPVPAPAPAPAPALVTGSVRSFDTDPGVDDFDEGWGPEDTLYVPASTAAGGGRAAAVAPPPRVRFDDDDDDPIGPPPARTIPVAADPGSRGGQRLLRLAGALGIVIVVAAIVVGLLAITQSGSAPKRTAAKHRTAPVRRKIAFDPAKVKVSVLNGTAVGGLAADIGKQLSGVGYTVPAASVTNAAVQTQTTTSVAYRPGDRADALQVAKALTKANRIAITTVVPASSTAITSCATPTDSGQAGTCPDQVIVTVGSDLAGAASSTTAG